MSDLTRSSRRLVPVLTTLAAVSICAAGCATAGMRGAVTAAPEPTWSAVSPSATPTPRTPQLLDACLVAVRDGNAPASEQLDRSTVESGSARSALRPDGLWYVVVPVTDPTVDAPLEYACLLNADMTVNASWGRIAPDADDFDQWSTATEPADGL